MTDRALADNPAHSDPSRLRLDQALAERGLARSRAAARDAILRGTVTVDGRPCRRPAQRIAADADLKMDDPAGGYVSRSALKLVAALDAFAIDVTGRNALDLGASTGGFTQVLLERGAGSVAAIDVGHGQLAPLIADDPRVRSIEGLNARDLTAAHLQAAPDLIVADLSFISLTQALEPALALSAPSARLVVLVKPQFEVGREWIGKGGLVREDAPIAAMFERLQAFLEDAGWTAGSPIPAPLTGGDGNQEYLLDARRPR